MKTIRKPQHLKRSVLASAALLTMTVAAPAQADPAGVATLLGGTALLGLLVHASQPIPQAASQPAPQPVRQAAPPAAAVYHGETAIIYTSVTPAAPAMGYGQQQPQYMMPMQPQQYAMPYQPMPQQAAYPVQQPMGYAQPYQQPQPQGGYVQPMQQQYAPAPQAAVPMQPQMPQYQQQAAITQAPYQQPPTVVPQSYRPTVVNPYAVR
ncbi:MAG: hypothetical protein HQL50_03470 [Magnetococcales bacterium]|nr:hypothetical protein [Magnetococcales bacterium]